jgi:uncharacterized repeat protein (TIGR03803 family)
MMMQKGETVMHTPFRQSCVDATAPLGGGHRTWLATCSAAALLAPPRRLGARARRPGALTLCTVLALALTAFAAAPAVATERTLYVFPESGVKGCYPGGTLFRAAPGALYGTTWVCGAYDKGTVFQLKPPAPGQTQWTLAVLYMFRGDDGNLPNAGLVMDARGALYGTTQFGGQNDYGVVFKLTPPAPGRTAWTETVLHDFRYNYATGDTDGAMPAAGLLMDATGALYGTTISGGTASPQPCCGFGTVFKLTPPRPGTTTWTKTVLYRFAGGADGSDPAAALTADGTGALYGTTLYGGTGACTDGWGVVVGCGTVFKLTPPRAGQTTWTKRTLYRFIGGSDGGEPQGKLLLDASGALYGTTFQGGRGQCSVDWDGIGCGTVFKLTPPAPGQSAWRKSVLHNFAGPEGAYPQGGVIADAAGHLYGTASGGGHGVSLSGDGVVFKLRRPAPGQTRWTATALHYFDILTSGRVPIGELVAAPTGQLFGVAFDGGQGLVGTVFQVTP